jgi:GntR family transcriptional regulator of arabinose operon
MSNLNIPKYAEIHSFILEYIRDNSLRNGDKLPTEKQLSDKFNVSRITIQRALRDLNDQGFIYKIQGGGTYVGSIAEQKKHNIDFIPLIISRDNPSTRFFEIIQGAENYLSTQSSFITIHTSNDDYQAERNIINRLINSNAKCLMILPCYSNENVEFYFNLIKDGINIVFLDILPNGLTGNLVCCDNVYGGYLATSHLIKQGYRKIAIISAKSNYQSSINERINGHRLATNEANLPVQENYLKYFTDVNEISGLVDELMSLENPPDAIFSINDVTAVNILTHLQNRNIRVPEDVALIGFDNLDIAANQSIPISSINQKFYDIGYKAAMLCFDLIKNSPKSFTHYILPVSIIQRQSTNPKC